MKAAQDLVIIGAGPAGLAAALEASALGLQVVVIDTYPEPGGQFLHQYADRAGDLLGFGTEVDITSNLQSRGVQVFTNTIVWGIFPSEAGSGFQLALYAPKDEPAWLSTRNIILAPGAIEQTLPFPGWTLPGVMQAGAARLLIESPRLIAGKRVLLSGTGVLQWSAARRLIRAGANVVAMLDANPFPWNAWRGLGSLWGEGERLLEASENWWTFWRAGIRVYWNSMVRHASGKEKVEQVVFQKKDRSEDYEVKADYVFLGFGLTASTQLALQAGAELRLEKSSGYYLPVRDAWLQSSLPGIAVVGDGAGIQGKEASQLEGRLAAMVVADRQGLPVNRKLMVKLQKQIIRQRRFANWLNTTFPFPWHLLQRLDPQTILCRCEEVTLGDIQKLLSDGITNLDNLKALTRIGMGRCQGRICGGVLTQLVASATQIPISEIQPLRPRPPIFPVPLEVLLQERVEHDS